MPTEQVIRCRLPTIDASQRKLTPVGTAVFVAFSLFWLLVTSAFALYRWSLDRAAIEVDAEIVGYNSIRFIGADGTTHEVERPYENGWSPKAGDRVRIRYQPDELQPLERVESAKQQRTISLILPLLALPMLGFAAWVHRRMKAEDARRLRLRQLDQRVPVTGFRVVTERVGMEISHTEYRVFATFVHRGRRYEAPSDRFLHDPSAEIEVDRVRVLLDPDDPVRSMLAADTLPERRVRGVPIR